MDANKTYYLIYMAMGTGKHEKAREWAIELQKHLADGGHYPTNYPRALVDRYLASVISRTERKTDGP